jgi:methionyl-tRNA formyltransferase
MRSSGSVPALRALLGAGYEVPVVVMPGPPGMTTFPTLSRANDGRGKFIPLTVVSTESGDGSGDEVDGVARAAGIPMLLTGDLRQTSVVEAIAAYRPDVIAVSCFPFRVPPALLALPRYGCLNVHSSLLPCGRGVDPVFWTFRRGEEETGITVHLMDEDFDSGPILLQERMAVPAGIRLPDFERDLYQHAGQLLVKAIDGLIAGEITPAPQDDWLATPAPTPTDEDFGVPTEWPARRAYNFVRAVAPLDGPLVLRVVATGECIRLRDAISCSPDGRQERPVEWSDEVLSVRFTPGVVRFQTAGTSATAPPSDRLPGTPSHSEG